MKSAIADQKEKDVVLLRKILLGIIEDEDIPKKDRIEASKLLARLHHALQVDRTTVRATATANPKQSLDRPLSKKERDEIDNLIKPIEPQS
jgi:hypothetical protein